VRLQTDASNIYKGSLDVFRKSLTSEGPLALFKGMSAPLVTATAVNALVFSSYGASTRWLDGVDRSGGLDWYKHHYTNIDFLKSFVSGCFAGIMQCLLICPTEHIK
jgi:hypothetical protein